MDYIVMSMPAIALAVVLTISIQGKFDQLASIGTADFDSDLPPSYSTALRAAQQHQAAQRAKRFAD